MKFDFLKMALKGVPCFENTVRTYTALENYDLFGILGGLLFKLL